MAKTHARNNKPSIVFFWELTMKWHQMFCSCRYLTGCAVKRQHKQKRSCPQVKSIFSITVLFSLCKVIFVSISSYFFHKYHNLKNISWFYECVPSFYGLGDKTSLRRYVTAQMLYLRVSCWYLYFHGSLRTSFQIDTDAQSHQEWSGAYFRAWELITSVSHLLYYRSMKLQLFNLSLCILFSLGIQSPQSCSQTSFPIQWAVLEVLQAPEACV